MPKTLVQIFLDAASKHSNSTLFMRRNDVGWESLTGERAQRDVESLALGLRQFGIRKGDRVALLAETRYEWSVSDLAILSLGAVTVPIYPTLTPAQCRHMLDNSETRAVIVSTTDQLEKVRSVRAALPKIDAVLVMDLQAPDGQGEHGWHTVLANGVSARNPDGSTLRTLAADVRPDDLATIIYTSGTTGDPKGAMLTHGNISSNVEACLQLVTIGPDDVSLSFLPLCHIFERMAGLYGMLAGGATIAYARNLETVPADAVEVRPTIINGVPRFYEKAYARVLDHVRREPEYRQRLFRWGLYQGLLKARARFHGRTVNTLAMRIADRLVGAAVRKRLGGRLRVCISGGAALSAEIMEFFFAMGITILEGYGLTETSPVICLNRPGRERPGTVGQPVPGAEVSIGENGEILTRGPSVMLGYYRDEEATRLALRDGWFHTGDVGHLDDDGYLRITDRLKDLLVLAGGKKVAPQPLEIRLKSSPLIQEAVLLGDRKPYVVALIAPEIAKLEAEGRERGWTWSSPEELVHKPEARALFEAEIERVNADLAPFEKVRRFAVLPTELTQENGALTPTLKVKRRVMMSTYGRLIDELYAGHEVPARG